MAIYRTDVAIIGGSFGGVAAAIALLERGHSVVLTEEFPWIGGQVTSQALCVLDDLDHPSGETVGISRRYAEFRNRTRQWYRSHHQLSSAGLAQIHLCAGNARCSHLTAEPNIAYRCLMDWLQPYLESGQLILITGIIPTAASREGKEVRSITCSSKDDSHILEAKFFLDGSDCGDTYPILQIPYRLGSDSKAQFGEPHAALNADSTAVQCFIYCAHVEFVPNENHTIAKPARYEYFRDKWKFFLQSPGSTRDEPGYMFKPRILSNGARIVPFWSYRCTVDAANFVNVTSRATINVACIDYNEAAFLENPDRSRVLAEARNLTLAYLYWLQTEAPRDEGGSGYPEIRPMPESTGTTDGIAQAPYVREGRRLVAHRTVLEQDLSVAVVPTARAVNFPDAVGLGGYAIDIHARADMSGTSIWEPARPYQIPLSAMLSPELENFAVAGKCIGVSQVANGAYRMHPSEWAIGEAAGELAAFCLATAQSPPLGGPHLLAFQRRLIEKQIPMYWFEDIPFTHPGFLAAQLLALTGLWPGEADHLRYDPERSIARHRHAFLKTMERLEALGIPINRFREACLNGHNARKYDVAHRLVCLLDEVGWPAV